MFWFQEFHEFQELARLIGGILKHGILESERFCIGDPPSLRIFDTDPSLVVIKQI